MKTTSTSLSIPGSVRHLVEGPVGWIVLDNPSKGNAVSLPMWRQLSEALEQFAQDASVRCVVICGDGDRAFCPGANIDEKHGRDAERAAADSQITSWECGPSRSR